MTLTEIARRARVSRPTIYRRWPDIRFVLAELLTLRIAGVLDDVPDRAAPAANRWSSASSRSPNTCVSDEVVMSVLHNAPNVAMVYITERLGTSQQILIDTLAAGDQARPGRGQRAIWRPAPARRDVPADHAVGDSVRPDGRAHPRRRRPRRRTGPLTERIPETMTGSTALNEIPPRGRACGPGRRRAARRDRDRRRHHRHRHRPGRSDPRSARRVGGEARSGVRHQPVEFQAGAWRAALPRDRQCRHRAPQRHRTRNPDDPQRPSPRQGHAAAGSAAARR